MGLCRRGWGIWAAAAALFLPACELHAAQRIAWLWDRAHLPGWSQGHAAVLVQHVHLSGSQVSIRPRLDRPPLSPHTQVTPVVHVEVSVVNPPQPGPQARAAIIEAVLRAARASTSGWVQLDMEARPSQRDFYRRLVADLRGQLPPAIRLSVTALAWWCRSPRWLDGLAADEVVPMVFRMGSDATALRKLWTGAPHKLHPRCRGQAIGIGAPEPLPEAALAGYSKLYLFDARGWRGLPTHATP